MLLWTTKRKRRVSPFREEMGTGATRSVNVRGACCLHINNRSNLCSGPSNVCTIDSSDRGALSAVAGYLYPSRGCIIQVRVVITRGNPCLPPRKVQQKEENRTNETDPHPINHIILTLQNKIRRNSSLNKTSTRRLSTPYTVVQAKKSKRSKRNVMCQVEGKSAETSHQTATPPPPTYYLVVGKLTVRNRSIHWTNQPGAD